MYYEFDSNSTFTGSEQDQIEEAPQEWDTANRANGSGVGFAPADANHPATLTFATGSNPGGAFAYTDTMTNGGTVSSAVVTFDLQATIPGSSTLVYDPTGPGASTFFLKVALHEIGHTMGLDEIPDPPSGDVCDQVDGASVMNAGCNQNDSGGNLPTDVTSCDNAVVANEVYQLCQANPCASFFCSNFDPYTCWNFPHSFIDMTRYTYGDCYERWLVTDHYWCSSGGSCIYLYTTRDTYLGTYCY